MNSNDRLYAWFNVRPGEERSTSLMLFHSFFMGVSTVFFETAASALFLVQFEATQLPYVYLAAAAVSILTGLTYTRIKDRLSFAPLMTGTLGALFILVCLMRLGLSAFEAGWLVFSMMIAYRLISILTDLEYWAVAARLYDVQQSKRLFSLIGSGEVTARILGAFSVPLLVGVLGVPNLLWLSAVGLAMCVLLLVIIVKSFPEVMSRGADDETSSDGGKTTTKKSIRPIWGNRYLRLIFLLALCAVLGKYFVDFAFLTQMQTRWHAVENLASFFGLFSGITQLINLLVRALISGRVLSRFGVGIGLLVLPVAHFLCTVAIVSMLSVPGAVFWLVISNQGLYKTLKHSIDNPSFKILYQPLPRRERLAAQIVVEVIVTPAAIALAAALMIGFGTFGASTAFSYLMLANFVAWTIAAIFAFREYGAALLRALEKRSLDRASFSIEDEKSIVLLRSKLESEYPEDVIFALDLLQRVDSGSLETHWTKLLDHPSADVRRYVLLQVERSTPDSLASAVGRLVSQEKDSSVKAAGLRALAALGDPVDQVVSHLHDPDPVIERGALIGLLHRRSEPKGADRAQRRLEELAVSQNPGDRALACRVLRETGWHETSTMVLSLMDDEDLSVRRQALRAAGKRGDKIELARVLKQLAEPRARADATRAILDAGPVAAPLLAEALFGERYSCQARAHMARIAGRLDSFESDEALWHAYLSSCEPVRQEALRALAARRYSRGEQDLPEILRRIEHEVEEATWELGVLRDLGAHNGGGEFDALADSLKEEIEQSRERILLLLSFIYDRRTMLSARDNLQSTSREKRAYATEILEVTLSQELKELTLPLLENLEPADRLARLDRRFPQRRRSPADHLREVLTRHDGRTRSWTKACAVYGAAKSSMDGLSEELERLARDASHLVAETSRWALGSPDTNGSQGMLTIEKVLLLKGVGMFAATSEDILADVASILEEVELTPGELVFAKGEQGDSMYIIVSGRVRVFDGDKTINFLDEREIFGELALLDPEPRSASVEAVEDTRLFRLDRNTLFELMSDNVGVVSGIMQVLCQRLRRMTAIATGAN